MRDLNILLEKWRRSRNEEMEKFLSSEIRDKKEKFLFLKGKNYHIIRKYPMIVIVSPQGNMR